MGITRRHLAKLALSAAPVCALPASTLFGKEKINSRINGVMLGAQTSCFREMPLADVIAAFREVGIGCAELHQSHVMPKSTLEIKRWRTTAPLLEMKSIRKKFDDAGIQLYAFNYDFLDDFTDAEIQHGFEIAKALGVRYLTTTSRVSMAPRLDGFARAYKIVTALYNQSEPKKDELVTPEDFAAVLKDTTHIELNLDVANLATAGYDPIAFLKNHFRQIAALQIHDRKKAQGLEVPLGQGATPIKDVLKTMQDNKFLAPAIIEYRYEGGNAIDEVRRSFEYCRDILNG